MSNIPHGNVYRFQNWTPTIAPSAYIAPGAHVIGQVHLAAKVHILFNVVLRGDNAAITVGEGSNIQDNSTIHVEPAREDGTPQAPCTIGKNVTIGHNCLVHGATIEDEVLIGMGAVVMNFAKIGRGCIVGAGAIVLEHTVAPPFSLLVGAPAIIKKTYPSKEALAVTVRAAQGYQQRIEDFKTTLRQQNMGHGQT